MKKNVFLIGALVMIAMSAMFVGCKENAPVQGCTCTATDHGEIIHSNEYFTLQEMAAYGATTCSGFASALQGALISHGETGVTWSCR